MCYLLLVVTTAVFDQVSVTGGGLPFIAPDNSVAGIAAPDFRVYPNPTAGEVNLDLSAYTGRAVRLELYDVNGKAVKTEEIEAVGRAAFRLNLSGLNNGVYVIRVKTEGPDATKRVVVYGNNKEGN